VVEGAVGRGREGAWWCEGEGGGEEVEEEECEVMMWWSRSGSVEVEVDVGLVGMGNVRAGCV